MKLLSKILKSEIYGGKTTFRSGFWLEFVNNLSALSLGLKLIFTKMIDLTP